MAKSRTIQLVIAGKDRVSKTLKKITGSLKKWGVGALKITGGLVAGFGAVTVALGAMFSKLSDQIDNQAKIASSLGLTYEKLGVLKDAAGYAGISVEGLSTALKKMSQNVADAADGTGEAQDAIKELGLDAKKLEQMGPDRAFKEIITQLDKIPNGIKKTQIAMDLFGRSGSSMTNLTSKGLKQAQKDADTLGLKLTEAQRKGVEAANDSWVRIKIVAGDFLKYLTAKLAPGIKKGFDRAFEFIKKQDLKAWADRASQAFINIGKALIQYLPKGLVLVLRGVENVTRAFSGWKMLWAELQYQFGGFMQFVWTGLNQIRNATNALHEGLVKRGLASPGGNEDGKRIAEEQQQILAMIAQKRAEALKTQQQEINSQKKQSQTIDDYVRTINTLEQEIKNLGSSAGTSSKAQVEGINKVISALQRQIEMQQQLNAEKGKSGGTFNVASFSNALDDEEDK